MSKHHRLPQFSPEVLSPWIHLCVTIQCSTWQNHHIIHWRKHSDTCLFIHSLFVLISHMKLFLLETDWHHAVTIEECPPDQTTAPVAHLPFLRTVFPDHKLWNCSSVYKNRNHHLLCGYITRSHTHTCARCILFETVFMQAHWLKYKITNDRVE